jgi:membrane protein DedA with SNARE-associated domain
MVMWLTHAVVLGALHGDLRDVADQVARHGYVILFVLIAAESLGLPLPGEVSLLVGAYEVQYGSFALPLVILVGAAAAVTGDNAAYLLGRSAGRPVVERLLRRLHVPPAYLDRMDAYFRGHAGLTVAIARQLSPVRGLAALSAGGTRVPWRRFFVVNALACVAWATVVTLLATLLVAHLDELADDLSLAGAIIVGAGLAVAVAGALLWRRARRRRRAGAAASARPGSGDLEPAPVGSDDPPAAGRRDDEEPAPVGGDDPPAAGRRDDEHRLTG